MDANRRFDSKSSCTRREIPSDRCVAFTLIELLVVLATLGILALLLLPALASTQPRNAKVFQCLNNMRQMAVAWTLYSEDNHDRLECNYDTSSIQNDLALATPTYASWVEDIMSWAVTPSVTNLVGIQKAPFNNYVGGNCL